MISIDEQVHVDAAPKVVFPVLADPEAWPRWRRRVADATQVRGHEPDVDTTYHVTGEFGPQSVDTTVILTAYDPPTQARFSVTGGVIATGTLTCRPADGGTDVSVDVDVELAGIWATLIRPLIRRRLQQGWAHDLAALKEVVEAGT